MNYLFIHNNFPGQFQHVITHLVQQPGNRVVALTQENQNRIAGVEVLTYEPFRSVTPNIHPYLLDVEQAVIWGQAVHEACRRLTLMGFRPDIVIGHPGWGETLFVKDVWPDVPLLSYFEFYYRASGADVGFDTQFYPVTLDDAPRIRVKNAVTQLAFEATDWGQCPTRWQASLHPEPMQKRMTVVHEGVDTDFASPGPGSVMLPSWDRPLTQADQVVTFFARTLEPYRGFHTFMRAVPEIQRRNPRAHILIVGREGTGYGAPPPGGSSYRALMLAELGGSIDLGRVHFLGTIHHHELIEVMRISSAHIYLTYPFVLSWSALEAMSAGCLMIGSATPPVQEVIRDGQNGLLVDFFDVDGLARRVTEALEKPEEMRKLREAARRTVLKKYDLKTVTLPAHLRMIEAVRRGEDPRKA